MGPDDAFLHDIRQHPEDDAPRLVYADWLEDNGDPDRAEFIRAQVESARLGEEDPRRLALEERARKLARANERDWLQPLREALNRPRCRQLAGWEFRRGFVEELSVTPRRPDCLAPAAAALARLPLRSLALTGYDVGLDAPLAGLARLPELGCLRKLWVYGSGPLTAAGLRAVGQSPHLGRLDELSLSFDLAADDLRALADTPLAARLISLHTSAAAGAGPGVWEALTAAPRFPALVSLGVYAGRAGEEGLARLIDTPHLPALRELSLLDQTLGEPGMASLVRSGLLRRLTRLHLQHCPVGDETAALAQALPSLGLRELWLTYAGLSTTTVSALVEAPSWGALEELDLSGNRLGDAGARAIAGCPHAANLRRLELYSCGLTDAGARALAESPHLERVRLLRLYEPDLSLGARRRLRKRFGARFRFGLR